MKSEAQKAARRYADRRNLDGDRQALKDYDLAMHDFLAGAAWQREQAAKLVEMAFEQSWVVQDVLDRLRAGEPPDDRAAILGNVGKSPNIGLRPLGPPLDDNGKPITLPPEEEESSDGDKVSQCHPQPGKGDTYGTVDGKTWCSSCHAEQPQQEDKAK